MAVAARSANLGCERRQRLLGQAQHRSGLETRGGAIGAGSVVTMSSQMDRRGSVDVLLQILTSEAPDRPVEVVDESFAVLERGVEPLVIGELGVTIDKQEHHPAGSVGGG